MFKYAPKILLSSALLLLFSCIDEISFDPPSEFQDSIAIIGKIVKGNPSVVEVSVQNLFDFSFSAESFITAQRVSVFNERGDQLDIPISGAGEYKRTIDPSDNFEVEIGERYGIEVSLFSGQAFRSELAAIVPVPLIDTIEHALVNKEILNFDGEFEFQDRIEYRVNTPLVSGDLLEKINLKWDFERAYKLTDDNDTICYVSTGVDFDLIQIRSHAETSIDFLTDFLVLEQPISQTMVEGQYVTIVQESLSDDAYEFWEQARALSTNSGTFYEPPPGQIITNINSINEDADGAVFGYFYGTEHDTTRLFIDSTFINLNINVCPRPPRAGPPVCDECCDCALFFTKELPSFWDR